MPVYMIIEVEIKDEKLYAEYVERAYQIVVKHGGRYLARGGQVTSLTGDWNPQRIIILEFETIDHLRTCFESEEYQNLAPLREKSTLGRAIVVEGCQPT